MKQSNIKTPLVFRIGVVLLCALLCSVHLMGELYARYSTSVSGGDGARVAVFGVVCSSDDANTTKSLEIGSSETVSYVFTVENTSEVTIQYTILLEGVPSGVTVSGNSGTFTLGIGAKREHTLTFQATDDATEVTEQKVSIKIDVVQVD